MAILGTLLKKGIKLRENLEQEYSSPLDLQKRELQELMITASATEFGKYYDFPEILSHFRKGAKDFYKTFTSRIPIHDYNKVYRDWWK
ncbi:MAG TPA: GH3 auxin-responsive promoter family protein, partial [Cyclobacteriaceae bacterium]